MSEWREVELGELCQIKGGKRLPKGEQLSESPTDHPYIRTRDLGNNKIAIHDLLFVPNEVFPVISRYIVEAGDIIISIVGTIGLVARIPEELHLASLTENCAKLVQIDDDVLYKEFLFYFLISGDGQDEIDQRNVGSTQPKLPLYNIKTIPIPIPPLPEQKDIAEVLSSLDDKIDLLHRQNKTLEQMAETLFRQWFVEEAQEDWEEKPLSSIANFLNGLACQKFPPKNDVDKLPVLKIKQLRNGFSVDSDWCTTEVKPEYIISDGDVIFSWSASLMVKIWDGEKCILNQHLFKVSSDEFPKWFYYLWSKHHLDEFVSISSSHATTMGHIKRGDLDDAMVLVPSPEEIQEFSEVFTPLIDKIISNNKRLKNLVSLRDALLPKLMSGEVRIASNG